MSNLSIFFTLGQKNLFESGRKVPGSRAGQPLIYCWSKVSSGIFWSDRPYEFFGMNVTDWGWHCWFFLFVGSGQPSLVWVWFWKKSQIFQFFPFGSKKSLRVGSKSTWVKDRSAPYIRRSKVRAHLYIEPAICYVGHLRSQSRHPDSHFIGKQCPNDQVVMATG